ncbi:unnamed protein product [Microthlaspi erraticum]|uniref:K-box domain-containing protein n=1 Tax=Microthlaspi erraticum TaxID=1685480 RepID=A0A6D2I801_9BRAS|nr:unnamed protein product [Microthlaspi erraticum]
MSVKELQSLERQLEGALSATRQRKERHLGDINKKLKLETKEDHGFKGFQHLLLSSSAPAGLTDFALQSSHHNSMDCDVGHFLQIGLQQQYEQGDGSSVLKSNVGCDSETNFVEGGVLQLGID